MKRFAFYIPVPDDIRAIHKLFQKEGLELNLVGGCVRDSVLRVPVKDWDLVTNANPDEAERILTSAGVRTLEIGKAFGVIKALTDEGEYEIATYRSDGEYSDSRRPDSVTFGTIEDDSARRDLTINALYYDLSTNEIIDFNGGLDDLTNKIIRTVGDAFERFQEDNIRVLRAIRFANRFRFELSEDIREVFTDGFTMWGVSAERIRDEFLKTLDTAKNKTNALNQLDEFDFLDQIFPGLVVSTKNVKKVLNASNNVTIAFLLRYNSVDFINRILNERTYSKQEVKDIAFLISLYDFDMEKLVVFKKKLSSTSLTGTDLKQFASATNLDAKLFKNLFNFKLTVDGNEVSEQFGVKGEALGKKILELEIDNFKKL